jgi:uncharacterized MnhB-related membrane protein
MWLYLFLTIALVLCAWQALHTKQILTAAIWLACASALVAVVLYSLGAPEVAVIELSVGAGLVTVLFVFGITIAGEEEMGGSAAVPWTLTASLMIAAMGLVAWFVLPLTEATTAVSNEPSFSIMLWEVRGLDMLVQIGLIFAGVLGVLGVLAERETAVERARSGQIGVASLPKPVTIIETKSETPVKEAHA